RRRSHRRLESRPRYCDSRREPGGGHGRDPRAWAAQRRNGSRELPRHGHDRSRPRRRNDHDRHDARASAGSEADEGLRRNVRRAERLDRRHVRRCDVPRYRGSESMKRELCKPRLRCALGVLLSLASAALNASAHAQPRPDTRSARERAPIDLSGQWVAVVDEDWRWRMVTPPVGDTSSLPVNERGRAAAAAWDLERDKAEGNLCKAFAGPGLMRQPTRIRIAWEDDD